jgi:carbonic anhydrase
MANHPLDTTPESDSNTPDTDRAFLNRRHFLTMLGLTGTLAAMGVTGVNPVDVARHPEKAPAKVPMAATPQAATISPDEALAKLLEGNKRFVAGKATYPHLDAARKADAAKGQAPFAAVISCSDSRVPPEYVFDVGLGDIFTARTAGNIADDIVIGSIEYAVAVLGAPLLVVLGHERCGAVVAAVDGKPLPGKIGELAKAIQPAVDMVKGKGGDVVDAAVRANVLLTVEHLMETGPILADYVKSGKLKIVGMRYDLDDVKVEVLS